MEEAATGFFKNPDVLKNNLQVIGNDNERYFIPKKGDYKEYFHLGRHTYKAIMSDQELGYLTLHMIKQKN